MGEWREYELGELTVKIGSGATPRGGSNAYKDRGVSFIRSQNVHDLKFSSSGLVFIDDEQANALKNVIVKPNDILLNITGDSVARVCRVPNNILPARVNQHVAIIRVKDDEITNDFLLYNLIFQKEKLLSQSEIGATRRAITKGMIEKFKVKLPILSEQKAIAEVLSSLDDKIDLLRRQNKTLEALAETLFRQWFVEEASEDWEVVKVGDVSEINQESIKRDYLYKKILYLDTSSITCGTIQSYQGLDLSEAPSRAKRLVRHNDIIISTVRPNQRHYGIIKEPAGNLVVSTGFVVVTATKVDPHFFYLLLTREKMTEHLHMVAEASTSAYPSLRPTDIAAVEFLYPPAEEMQKFAEIASSHWDKIDQNYRTIRTLEQLRDTLLPKLMNGEVHVSCNQTQNEEFFDAYKKNFNK